VVIVAIFVIAALITPPDIVSQVMVAIPMIALYELSIILCTICQKLHRSERQEEQ
jgi:sec-independent protein translocase protein TatC